MFGTVLAFLKGLLAKLTGGAQVLQAGSQNKSVAGVKVGDNNSVVTVVGDGITVIQGVPSHPKGQDDRFVALVRQIPELLEEMRQDLAKHPTSREFIIIGRGCVYCGDRNEVTLRYYFEDHADLRNKLRILENHNLIQEITYNNTDRFVFTEELVAYLQAKV